MADKMAADLSPTDNDTLEALLQVSSLRTDPFWFSIHILNLAVVSDLAENCVNSRVCTKTREETK